MLSERPVVSGFAVASSPDAARRAYTWLRAECMREALTKASAYPKKRLVIVVAEKVFARMGRRKSSELVCAPAGGCRRAREWLRSTYYGFEDNSAVCRCTKLFNMLKQRLSLLPTKVMDLLQAYVSLKRIEDFLEE